MWTTTSKTQWPSFPSCFGLQMSSKLWQYHQNYYLKKQILKHVEKHFLKVSALRMWTTPAEKWERRPWCFRGRECGHHGVHNTIVCSGLESTTTSPVQCALTMALTNPPRNCDTAAPQTEEPCKRVRSGVGPQAVGASPVVAEPQFCFFDHDWPRAPLPLLLPKMYPHCSPCCSILFLVKGLVPCQFVIFWLNLAAATSLIYFFGCWSSAHHYRLPSATIPEAMSLLKHSWGNPYYILSTVPWWWLNGFEAIFITSPLLITGRDSRAMPVLHNSPQKATSLLKHF